MERQTISTSKGDGTQVHTSTTNGNLVRQDGPAGKQVQTTNNTPQKGQTMPNTKRDELVLKFKDLIETRDEVEMTKTVDDETTTVKVTQFVRPIKLAEFIGRPPQMVYTYIKKEYIPSVTDANGKLLIPAAEGLEWTLNFMERQEERSQKKEAQVQQDLAGQSNNGPTSN